MGKVIDITAADAESARLLVEFADHWGESVSPVIRAMAEATPAAVDDATTIRLLMLFGPLRRYIEVQAARLGLSKSHAEDVFFNVTTTLAKRLDEGHPVGQELAMKIARSKVVDAARRSADTPAVQSTTLLEWVRAGTAAEGSEDAGHPPLTSQAEAIREWTRTHGTAVGPQERSSSDDQQVPKTGRTEPDDRIAEFVRLFEEIAAQNAHVQLLYAQALEKAMQAVEQPVSSTRSAEPG